MLDVKLSGASHARITAIDAFGMPDRTSEQPFEKLITLVKAVLDVPICALSMVDQTGRGGGAMQSPGARSLFGSRFLNATDDDTRGPMLVPDAAADPRYRSDPFVLGPPHIRSCAAVPLQAAQGDYLGLLSAIDTVPRTFSSTQIEVLKTIAAVAVDELELRQLADKDHLTGASTRRSFLADLASAVEGFERHHRPSALLLLDIDHFKSVNDCFGHPAGDIVLKAVAECCRRAVRLSDSFGRLGGEEFGILLLDTGPEEAWLAAERIRKTIANVRFDLLTSVRITASLGVAPLGAATGDVTRWLAQADEALYAAKRGGRDRTVLAV